MMLNDYLKWLLFKFFEDYDEIGRVLDGFFVI